MQVRRRRGPGSIQVDARERAPVVAVDDAVRVNHGDDLEDEAISELPSRLRGPGKMPEEPAHHPRGVRFTGVDPRCQKHSFPLARRRWLPGARARALGSSDGDEGHLDTCQSVRQGRQRHDAAARADVERREIRLEVAVGVGVAAVVEGGP